MTSASDTTFVSRYDLRIKLVQGIVKEDTKLSDKQSHALAVRLLHTIDTTPEKMR